MIGADKFKNKNNYVSVELAMNHIQDRLSNNKGLLLLRNSDYKWFVHCVLYKDKNEAIHTRENSIDVYNNYVTDLHEALENIICLLNYYETQIGEL